MLKRLRPLDMDSYYEARNNKWDDCNDEPLPKQQRSTNQFLSFCDLILKYEKYTPIKEEGDSNVYSANPERSDDSFSSSESNSSFGSASGTGDGQNEGDTDDDSWDLITCHCMKPFAGRPMIECTECQTWIHMSCAKIRRNNIPEDFVCQNCREARSSTRRSERIRSDDRRILTA